MALEVRKLRRVESWTDWKAAGGVRQAVLPEIIAAQATVTLLQDRLTLVLPLTSSVASFFTARSIMRIDESDTVYDEWMIVDRMRDSAGGTITLHGASIRSTEIAERTLVERVDTDGVVSHDFESLGLTPGEHIDNWILPALVAAGIDWISIGTIAPDARIDLTLSWDTPLSALLRIAEASKSELDLRRDGNVGYLIDLVERVNYSAQRADLRVDKNLVNVVLDENTIGQATRVYPRGASGELGHATMARAQWKVTNVAGNVVTLADAAGGNGPLQFDDQLNGKYLRKPDGSLTAISDSDATAQTVTVASATGVTTGAVVSFRANSSGKDMVWLENPAASDPDAYGVKVAIKDSPDVPGTNNLLKNPFMRDWPGALPVGWSAVGTPTTSKQTAAPFTALGGASIKVESNADAEGAVSDGVSIFPTDDNRYVSVYARVWIASGSIRVELLLTTAAGTSVVPIAPAVASNSVVGQWEDLGVSGIDAQAIEATSAAIRVVQNGTVDSVFYVDAAQITEGPAQQPLVEGSGGTRLWQDANEELRKGSLPVTSYNVPLVDLEQVDAATWSESALIIGAPARVRDPRLDIDILTRILEINRDFINPAATSVVLSNRFDDLTDLLAAFRRSGRLTPSPSDPTEGGDLPAVEFVNTPVPTYDDSGMQNGWELKGSVTDKCNSLMIELTEGLSIFSVYPLGFQYFPPDGTEYRADTTTEKSFVIELRQLPGDSGEISLTPRAEHTTTGGGGAAGPPYSQVLQRPPFTTMEVEKTGDPKRRSMTLSCTPKDSQIRYRLSLPPSLTEYTSWFEPTMPASGKITEPSIALDEGDVVVEFQSISAKGVAEEVKRRVIDLDDDAEWTLNALVESPANWINVALSLVDDDARRWECWARNGSTPKGADGEPLNIYRKRKGGLENLSFKFYAENGTWHVLVRVYDADNNWTEAIATIVIGGVASVDGALLGLTVVRESHGGTDYHELRWSHNQAVQDTAHTVTVMENGVALVTGRDPRLDHLNAAGAALEGGWHREMLFAPDPTAENAEFRIHIYAVHLKLAGVTVAIYQAQVSGYYLGDGDPDSPVGGGGGFPQAPTPVIGTAGLAAYSARATWTDNELEPLVRINWEFGLAPTYDFVGLDGGDVLLNPGTLEHVISNLPTGAKVRARIRYSSAVEVGAWSNYSNELIVAGSGGGSVAPTTTPSVPTLTNQAAFIARAAWAPASSIYKTRARFEYSADGLTGWALAGTTLVLGGITQADKSIIDGMFARAQIAYENAGGTGPYSAFSNVVEILV